MGRVLDGFPWWGQLTDPDPTTGRPDLMAMFDCGEEVASIWIAHETGGYTDAADLRRSLGHADGHGQTSPEELALLLNRSQVSAGRNTLGLEVLRDRVKEEINANHPVALLGYWLRQDVLHWVLCVGYGNNGAICMEPYSGGMVVYSWPRVLASATGDVVMHTGK